MSCLNDAKGSFLEGPFMSGGPGKDEACVIFGRQISSQVSIAVTTPKLGLAEGKLRSLFKDVLSEHVLRNSLVFVK